MFDPALFILRTSYYYSRFLGLINFDIDTKTGYAKISRKATIHAIVANMVVISLVPMLFYSELIHIMWLHAGLLHEYLFLLVMSMRISCVLGTIFSRWLQRRRLIRLINAIRGLAIQRPQVIPMWRRRILIKFCSVFFSEVIQLIGSLLTMQTYVTLNLAITVLLLYMLTALMNVIIAHYYFSMLNIHSHYKLILEELRVVLSETRALEHEPRRATFMIKCCVLADRLEVIARTQSKLHYLVDRMQRVFGIQGVFISMTSYITSIGSIFFGFAAIRRFKVTWSLFMYIFLGLEIVAYFIDVYMTVSNMFYVHDDYAEIQWLMEQYSTVTPALDERLRIAFESFQLQLAKSPMRIYILGLYEMARNRIVAMASAVITNSIVLIQYEMKYS